MNPYEAGLDQGPSNYVPLTPVSFLQRSAAVYPKKAAVIHGDRMFTYAEFFARCRRPVVATLARCAAPMALDTSRGSGRPCVEPEGV